MPIDWFTVAAQALNFVVLVWLLKRFLYGPVLAAIDARDKRVAAELADAAAKQAQAQSERDAFARRNADFDAQREQLMAQAKAHAAQERERLLEQAHQSVGEWSAARKASLLAQAQQLDQTIRAQAQQEIFAIARKTLQELAATELDELVCAVFVRRLRALDDGQLAQLRGALRAGTEPVLVRSAFVLSPAMREEIEKAVRTLTPLPVVPQYATSPALVSGVELLCGGYKIGWNIADYLDAMAEHVNALLQTATPGQTPHSDTASSQPASDSVAPS